MTSPGRGFQLVFLISNNLGENTTDGNAGASVNCDPAPNVEIVESDEGVDDLIPKEIAEKVSRWLQRNSTCRKNILQRKCSIGHKDRSLTIKPRHHQQCQNHMAVEFGNGCTTSLRVTTKKRSCENNLGKVSSINHSYLFNTGYVTCCIKQNKTV